ncbi:aspartyl-phosphate phosphatase Spo0E family protein [Paenibacillus roseipurpureus]|uniref:Aspartyl-phosphate phosphatase Spo0E family protein n=1 Tax=Paenibacillus roseopurpureus TaxID=2918901 RepID=A0AA96LPH5_9BACL|nr:aspartyl-phosphate phosphatase Spo0E family protein [Paenibacillus sp. MBLB1832]WNR45555.1 aspartyl-phosphate phosphatase Spo0E family protein [Paenibacillus sp. MBLB1832]
MPITRGVDIRKAIERKRREMHSLSDRYGMASQIVLRKSREIDRLLNAYGSLCKIKEN